MPVKVCIIKWYLTRSKSQDKLQKKLIKWGEKENGLPWKQEKKERWVAMHANYTRYPRGLKNLVLNLLLEN